MANLKNTSQVSKFVSACRKKDELFDIWKMFIDYKLNKSNLLTVMILNAPCMGFGDIVFAMKFYKILKQWYNCKIIIATTQKEGFIKLGGENEDIYSLNTKSYKDCRRFSRLRFYKDKKRIKCPEADVVFVAPLTQDFDPDIKDIQCLIPYANRFNTFFLSEYNDSLHKKIDFHTGVGGKRYGLLFTDTVLTTFPKNIFYPYAIIYISENIPRFKKCMCSFVEMVSKKYNNNNFEIIVPKWTEDENALHNITKIVKKYFEKVIVRRKGEKDEILLGNKNKPFSVSIRMDILPVPIQEMIDLIYYSVSDILLTGDQSITDALSCCSDKNIFYQIAPWKENFAKNLEKELPNKWLKRKSESCGNLKAIKYKSDYGTFRSKWDFRVLAKPKLDGIMNFISEKEFGRNSKIFKKYIETVLESKTLNSFKKKWNRFVL